MYHSTVVFVYVFRIAEHVLFMKLGVRLGLIKIHFGVVPNQRMDIVIIVYIVR